MPTPEHYCNGVMDPGVCCPVAHNPSVGEEYCTCWPVLTTIFWTSRKTNRPLAEWISEVLRRRYYQVHERMSHEYRETFRIDGVLKNHKLEIVDGHSGKYERYDCYAGRGSGPVKDDRMCSMCHESVDT